MLGFGNGGLVWAEQTIPSGFAALLVATTPFWMVGFDALMPGSERLTRRRVIGLVVGFIGVAMLVWPEIADAARRPRLSRRRRGRADRVRRMGAWFELRAGDGATKRTSS